MIPWPTEPRPCEGALLLQQALCLKAKRGVESAVTMMTARGIPIELAVLALVGSDRAERYGVHGFGYGIKASRTGL